MVGSLLQVNRRAEYTIGGDDMAVQTFSLRNDGETQITKNFKIKEFRCKDGSDTILTDVDFIKVKLQKIRDWAGAPIIITSAYRTESYNRSVGGAARSYHIRGQAYDIKVQGKTLDEVCRFAESIGILGIIRYPSQGFVHIDSRAAKFYSKDSGQSPCTSFQ